MVETFLKSSRQGGAGTSVGTNIAKQRARPASLSMGSIGHYDITRR